MFVSDETRVKIPPLGLNIVEENRMALILAEKEFVHDETYKEFVHDETYTCRNASSQH